MKKKEIYRALGLMSGTSMDGVDASIIKSDGETNYKAIYNKYYKFNLDFFKKIHVLSLRFVTFIP